MLQALTDFSRSSQSGSRYPEAIALMADVLPALFGAPSGALYICDGPASQLRRVAAWGPVRYMLEVGTNDCWALRLGEDYRQPLLPGVASCDHLKSVQSSPLHDNQCIPLIAAGRLQGMLVVADAPASGLPAGGGESLRCRILAQVAAILGHLHRRKLLEDQDMLDALTGLSNRRFLEAVLPQEIVRAARLRTLYGQAGVALLLMSVDDLNGINENHGRRLGDSVLQVVAGALKQQTRGSDVAARFGGDKFAIVLTDINPFLALSRSNALRKSLERLSLPASGIGRGQISGCFGLAHSPYHGTAAETLVKTAQQALARGRKDGGNCVVFGDQGRATRATVEAA